MHSAQALFFLNTAIWVALGIFSVYRALDRAPIQSLTTWTIVVLMFGNAAAMLLSGMIIVRSSRLGYYFVLAVLLVNMLLTFTDQIGTLDLITFLIDLILLVLVIMARQEFQHSNRTI